MIASTKKGQEAPEDISEYSVYFLFACIFFGILFVVFLTLVVKIHEQHVPEGLRKSTHTARFINNCFPYIDSETGRKYAGIIDYGKFTQERLAECYMIDSKTVAFGYQLRLTSEDNKDLDKTIRTSNYNHYTERTVSPILIFSNNHYYSGELSVDFQP